MKAKICHHIQNLRVVCVNFKVIIITSFKEKKNLSVLFYFLCISNFVFLISGLKAQKEGITKLST
jgi:hypothetical protein